tara:strand:+ start:625 stop:921 length:297 start_codon:yes stop_codon:yes gene_type:complete
MGFMSKQIDRLMEKFPQVFYDVSYEGNNEYGQGTWLYMQPGWYCESSDCGTIHEYTIAEVIRCSKCIYQNKERWIKEHPTETDEHEKMLRGDYDKSAL